MKNKYEIRGKVVAIFVYYKGEEMECMINLGDLSLVNSYPHKWQVTRSRDNAPFYVVGRIKENGVSKKIWIHRLIMDPAEGIFIDHKNHNTLDNRRRNLRYATHSENNQNVGEKGRGKSGYRNVFWFGYKWVVRVRLNGKSIYGGLFEDPKKASEVAKKLRKKHMPFAN